MFSPPPPFIHIPFDVLRVIINDAFCEAPHATIHSALGATISGTHVTEVMGEPTSSSHHNFILDHLLTPTQISGGSKCAQLSAPFQGPSASVSSKQGFFGKPQPLALTKN